MQNGPLILYIISGQGCKRQKLTAKLDIPIIGTEVLPGSHYSTAECIATGVVDMARSDVSWKGGITPVMKRAHLAEPFGVKRELLTTTQE